MKKGFTLIELLAVIIILAIVALIATPIVLDVVDNARVSAAKSEAAMIVSGVNNYCAAASMQEQLTGKESICTDADGVTKEDVATMVDLGNAKVNKITYEGKVTLLEIESNNKVVTYDGKKYTVNGLDRDDTPEELVLSGKAVCARKTVVTDGVLATMDNPYIAGGEYICNIGDDVLRTFFVLENSTNQLSLIMNENLGDTVAWLTMDEYIANWEEKYDYYEVGPITAMNYLNDMAKDWKNVSVSIPTLTQLETHCTNGTCPAWLKTNLSLLPIYDNITTNTYAYHISGKVTKDDEIVMLKVMSVDGIGYSVPMEYDPTIGVGDSYIGMETDNIVGVRPVITVSKDDIK